MPGMEVGLFPGSSSMEIGLPRRWGGQLANMRAPQLGIDLTEEENNWVVHADLPGFKDEDVELSIENGMLGVRAKRDKTTESDTGISHHVEVNKYFFAIYRYCGCTFVSKLACALIPYV